jgi:type VI protein secretion system component VasK
MAEKKKPKINRVADLTEDELRQLIRETVLQAAREAVQEFLAEASYNAEMTLRAEVTDYLRASLDERFRGAPPDDETQEWELDD